MLSSEFDCRRTPGRSVIPFVMVRSWHVVTSTVLCAVVGCYNQPSEGGDAESGTGSSGTRGTVGDGPDDGPDDGATDNDPDDGPATDGQTDDNPTATSDETTGEPETGDDDATTTGPPPSCAGEGPDPMCPGDLPFCAEGQCVDCEGLPADACGGLDGATPFCDAGVCSGCYEHDQCDTGACRMATGECFPEANRLWVDSTATCGTATGTEEAPFCDIVTAVAVVNKQAGTEPWALFVAGNPTPYDGTINSIGRPFAIIGPEDGLAAHVTGDNEALDLWSQSPETYVANMTLAAGMQRAIRGANNGACELWLHDVAISSGQPAVETGSCDMHMHRTEIFNQNTFGIVVSSQGSVEMFDSSIHDGQGGMMIDGTAHLERSVVSDSYTAGGIELAGGELTLINSLMHDNQYANDGINITDGGQLEMLYSTVIGAITCDGAGPSTIRNSIAMGRAFEAGQACTSAAVTNSVVNTGEDQGAGNVVATDEQLSAIFVDLSTANADFHLLPGASIPQDVAVWETGDPRFDVDMDERPSVDGTSDYAGFDVP